MAGEGEAPFLFDQTFFDEDLYKLMALYLAEHAGSPAPAVELPLGDGSVFRVKGTVVASESWAAFKIVDEEQPEAPLPSWR